MPSVRTHSLIEGWTQWANQTEGCDRRSDQYWDWWERQRNRRLEIQSGEFNDECITIGLVSSACRRRWKNDFRRIRIFSPRYVHRWVKRFALILIVASSHLCSPRLRMLKSSASNKDPSPHNYRRHWQPPVRPLSVGQVSIILWPWTKQNQPVPCDRQCQQLNKRKSTTHGRFTRRMGRVRSVNRIAQWEANASSTIGHDLDTEEDYSAQPNQSSNGPSSCTREIVFTYAWWWSRWSRLEYQRRRK